ncbi:uncharacterized protein LOC113385110 [Ctenocephalides felis]|uniref:uncharacterized protein LOC113384796 n=1 Tax=Ctenocephalides felis TaxID=7515 RepID=UPI000E6E33DE|nr:uncharacterized protein LOC113384796 [Ctenocephalides felis]XP_026478705.1 uncharacterized protein LOC113385110 [Ctenocephalides felis]
MCLKIEQLKKDMDIKHQALLKKIEENCQCKKSPIIEPGLAEFVDSNLPLKNECKLRDFEEQLRDSAMRQKVKTRLARVGGGCDRTATYSLLRKVFDDAVAREYCWTGDKTRKNFSALLTVKLIIEIICENFVNKTEFMVIDHVKGWLRASNYRFKRRTMALENID